LAHVLGLSGPPSTSRGRPGPPGPHEDHNTPETALVLS
jgi:hypothetical protein